jgi:TolB-like protein/tetratricopeptide (TPR) repeat protein
VPRVAPPAAGANRTQRLVLMAAAGLFMAVFLGGIWWFWPADPARASPSIAVLPFDNLGGDEATGRLAEGLTEDIITDLARYRDLDVIARNSTGVYRGVPVDIRKVGTDLDVGYVLEGSIQRQGNHVRVTAQLIDAQTGAHAWSQRWDRRAADVFVVQTEIAERVASTLGGYGLLTSQSMAAANRKRPDDLQAYDLWALGYEAFLRGAEADLNQALAYLDAAIAKDPDFVRAYTKKAWTRLMLAKFRNDWSEAIAEMERLARIANSIDPYDAEVHVILGFTSAFNGQWAEARASTAKALELNPSSADILNLAAGNMSYLGEPDRGAEMCDRSFQLNPSPAYWYNIDCPENYFFVGRYEDAVDAIDRFRARAVMPNSYLVYRAASLAGLGRTKDAVAAVEELAQLDPTMSLEMFLNTNLFARDQDVQRILDSARNAGVRTCAVEGELSFLESPRRLPGCLTQ